MKKQSKLPTPHKLALVAAALTLIVASIHAFFMIGAIWSQRDLISTMDNAATYFYLPLATRIGFIVLATATISSVLARSIITSARLSLLLHVVLLLVVFWSIGSFYFSQDFHSYSQATGAAKLVVPATRLLAGLWLILVAKALLPFTKQSTSGI